MPLGAGGYAGRPSSQTFLANSALGVGLLPKMTSTPRPPYVGGDGDGAGIRPGLGDDLSSLARDPLALRTAWGIPLFLSRTEMASDLSMERVPTRMGWPQERMAMMSSTTALNLIFSSL